MQQITSSTQLRDQILDLLDKNGLDSTYCSKILDYTIELFHAKRLDDDYYWYHNIVHELEVTYVTLIAAQWESFLNNFTKEDLTYLFVAALFHDYDPSKQVDKPHEEDAVKFVKTDKKLLELLKDASTDENIIATLILRTTYPWSGELQQKAEKQIEEHLSVSDITKNDPNKKEHYKKLGWFLSVADRIGGYALGDFTKALEMAKKNAHALAWHPNLIVRRSVAYFEDLLNNEAEMCERILRSLPKQMRKSFTDNVLLFMKLREQEIQIKASFVYDNLKIVPTIETMKRRQNDDFVNVLFKIYEELPHPLQFNRENFSESVRNPTTLLNTLRLGTEDGPIIGFAKGGPLEDYKLRAEIKDHNYGMFNTIFLEPTPLKMGYWGQRGGREMRLLFTMQAEAKGYKCLTSFALRDVIQNRINRNEKIEFVKQFDPERWDYYRCKLK
ncbi:MAG: HD domain-containing protein [Nitrosopumilaceae archaeon]